MAEARGETAALASTGGANIEKFAAVGKGALLGLGVVAVGVGVLGVKAALDMEVAQKRLETAVKNSGQSYGRYSEDVENAEAKGRSLGFTNEDVANSLAKLQPITKDAGRSIDDLGLAEDIARGRHIDLSTATDILTKVENGRVSMLGRIGISTKDATGATISQEEAIRRLTAMYGGQASAYTDTFQGKMAVLAAQAENVAEKIGQFLIPILTDLGGALVDGIGWLEQHRAVAIALGVAIGGPLVAAMAAYVATSLAAFATTGALGTGLELVATGAIMTGTAVQGLVVDLVAMEAAELVALGGFGLLVAAVGAFVGLVALGDGPYERMTAAGDKWAKSTIEQARALGTNEQTLTSLQASHRLLAAQIHETEAAQARLNPDTRAYIELGYNATRVVAQLAEKSLQLHREYDDLTPVIKKLTEEHRQSVLATEAVAHQYGVVLPASYHLNSAENKVMQKAMAESGDTFGQAGLQAELYAHMTGAAMRQLAAESKQFASDLASSVQKATDPFAHDFGAGTVIAEADMEAFFTSSNLAAQTWMTDLRALMATGVNQGIIENIARAGPESDPKLQAFQQMVDLHGAEWVNSQLRDGAAAEAATTAAFDKMAFNAAIKTAEMNAVVKAYMADMRAGGTAHLEALAASGNGTFAGLAYDAAVHMAEVRASIDMVPNEKDIHVTFTVDWGSWGEVGSAINRLTNQNVSVPAPGGAHGLVALARGGAAGMIVGPHRPVVIGEGLSREAVVPFDNFADMVATIRNTGAAGQFAAAAMAAGAGSRMGFSVDRGGRGDTGGIGGGGSTVTTNFIIVRDINEALHHVPAEARAPAKAKFLEGRR